jgi:hypothetical protein
MNPFLYAPSRETTVQSLPEALELANSDFAYNTREFQVRNLNLDGEGHILIGNQDHPVTMDGMNGLCSRFRIPNPFAGRIPYDLLKTNILRLARDAADETLIVHSRNDGAVVNISKGLTIPPNNAEVISRTMRLFPGEELDTRINLGDKGVDIDLIRGNAQIIEARVGDPIKVGLRISTSESSFWTGYAKTLLYILRCTNGAVMSKSFGAVKLRIKLEMNPNTVYNLFFKKVIEFVPNFNNLSALLQRSGSLYMFDSELVNVWKSISRRGVDYDVIDMLIGIGEGDRGDFISRVKTREKHNEVLVGGQPEPPQPTTIKVYDVFDRITSHALVCHQELRQDLEVIAGDIIANLASRQN